jgi:hypothetical protein
MEKKYKLLFAAIILFVGCVIADDFRNAQRSFWSATGHTTGYATDAAIIDPHVSQDGENDSEPGRYVFRVRDQTYEGWSNQATRIGDTVDVHYNPANPEFHHVAGERPLTLTIFFGIALIVVGACWMYSLRYGKTAREILDAMRKFEPAVRK